MKKALTSDEMSEMRESEHRYKVYHPDICALFFSSRLLQ